MTCIVGLKTPDSVILAADRLANVNNVTETYHTKKIFKKSFIDGSSAIFGFCGAYRLGDILNYRLSMPNFDGADVNTYLVNTFIPRLIECFKYNGFLTQDEDGALRGGEFLLGFSNRLFLIQDDFSVLEPDNGYTALGTGMEYALGSLYSTSNIDMNQADRAKVAVLAASNFSPTVGGSVDVIFN
jgi:ATP-dependent protease HslVU (ClpYQ) peptidase subunit